MRYVPFDKLAGEPNIIVDAMSTDGTVLNFSHWPGNKTAPELKADLSAEIVFKFLDSRGSQEGATAVSNNHFDEDGLVGIWSLLNPDEALSRREFLIDVANAGDFGIYKDRDAARVSFVLKAWTKLEESPLNEATLSLPYPEVTAVLYEELLPRFINILDKTDYLEDYWKKQDDLLELSEKEIERGHISIQEFEDIDLAVVTLPEKPLRKPAANESLRDGACHIMAVHNQTNRMRILLMRGQEYELYFRYETWVEYISRQLVPRVDLTKLAEELNSCEKTTTAATWSFEGVKSITPSLSTKSAGKSTIAPQKLKQTVMDFLKQSL